MADFASIRFQSSRPLLRELSADRLNSILAEIRRNKPKGERGITVRQSGDGTYIGLAASIKKAGGAEAVRQPWDIYISETMENGNYKIKVVPGTISNVLADNWDFEFTASEDTVYFAKARVATDAQDITGVSILFDDSEPSFDTPQLFATPATIDVVFGLFFNGKSYRTISPGSPVYSPKPWITVPKINAAPGELPYEIYYTLLP